jgi:hypothetical protein
MPSNCKNRCVWAWFALTCWVLAGCTYPFTADSDVLSGVVYAKYKIPLTRNLHRTPNEVVIHAGGKVIRIKEPITGYGIYAEFNVNAIGDIARHYGITTVDYADQEIFNVLGVWRHDRVIITGEADDRRSAVLPGTPP